MTESELLDKIREDPAKFSLVFDHYYKPIFGYILRRTGDFDITADLAANTFYQAFTHIKKFSYHGVSIKVWLYRIATNEVNQFYRHKRKQDSLIERLVFEDRELFRTYISRDKKEMEREMELHKQFIAVLEALKTLPGKYQEVIALRYFEGMDNKEIVEILDMKEGTLKSLLSRGLEKLREKCNQL